MEVLTKKRFLGVAEMRRLCSKFPKYIEILIKIVYNIFNPKSTLSTVKLFLLSTSITK